MEPFNVPSCLSFESAFKQNQSIHGKVNSNETSSRNIMIHSNIKVNNTHSSSKPKIRKAPIEEFKYSKQRVKETKSRTASRKQDALLSMYHINLANYIEEHKVDVKLTGAKRFSDKSGDYYLKNILFQKNADSPNRKILPKLSLTHPETLNSCISKCKDVKVLEPHVDSLTAKLPIDSLTPIPVIEKTKVSHKYASAALSNAERCAVHIRRLEYSKGLVRTKPVKKEEMIQLEKIVYIQKWWKILYAIKRIQSFFKGCNYRRKLYSLLKFIEGMKPFETKLIQSKMLKLCNQFKLLLLGQKMKYITNRGINRKLKDLFLHWRDKANEVDNNRHDSINDIESMNNNNIINDEDNERRDKNSQILHMLFSNINNHLEEKDNESNVNTDSNRDKMQLKQSDTIWLEYSNNSNNKELFSLCKKFTVWKCKSSGKYITLLNALLYFKRKKNNDVSKGVTSLIELLRGKLKDSLVKVSVYKNQHKRDDHIDKKILLLYEYKTKSHSVSHVKRPSNISKYMNNSKSIKRSNTMNTTTSNVIKNSNDISKGLFNLNRIYKEHWFKALRQEGNKDQIDQIQFEENIKPMSNININRLTKQSIDNEQRLKKEDQEDIEFTFTNDNEKDNIDNTNIDSYKAKGTNINNIRRIQVNSNASIDNANGECNDDKSIDNEDISKLNIKIMTAHGKGFDEYIESEEGKSLNKNYSTIKSPIINNEVNEDDDNDDRRSSNLSSLIKKMKYASLNQSPNTYNQLLDSSDNKYISNKSDTIQPQKGKSYSFDISDTSKSNQTSYKTNKVNVNQMNSYIKEEDNMTSLDLEHALNNTNQKTDNIFNRNITNDVNQSESNSHSNSSQNLNSNELIDTALNTLMTKTLTKSQIPLSAVLANNHKTYYPITNDKHNTKGQQSNKLFFIEEEDHSPLETQTVISTSPKPNMPQIAAVISHHITNTTIKNFNTFLMKSLYTNAILLRYYYNKWINKNQSPYKSFIPQLLTMFHSINASKDINTAMSLFNAFTQWKSLSSKSNTDYNNTESNIDNSPIYKQLRTNLIKAKAYANSLIVSKIKLLSQGKSALRKWDEKVSKSIIPGKLSNFRKKYKFGKSVSFKLFEYSNQKNNLIDYFFKWKYSPSNVYWAYIINRKIKSLIVKPKLIRNYSALSAIIQKQFKANLSYYFGQWYNALSQHSIKEIKLLHYLNKNDRLLSIEHCFIIWKRKSIYLNKKKKIYIYENLLKKLTILQMNATKPKRSLKLFFNKAKILNKRNKLIRLLLKNKKHNAIELAFIKWNDQTCALKAIATVKRLSQSNMKHYCIKSMNSIGHSINKHHSISKGIEKIKQYAFKKFFGKEAMNTLKAKHLNLVVNHLWLAKLFNIWRKKVILRKTKTISSFIGIIEKTMKIQPMKKLKLVSIGNNILQSTTLLHKVLSKYPFNVLKSHDKSLLDQESNKETLSLNDNKKHSLCLESIQQLKEQMKDNNNQINTSKPKKEITKKKKKMNKSKSLEIQEKSNDSDLNNTMSQQQHETIINNDHSFSSAVNPNKPKKSIDQNLNNTKPSNPLTEFFETQQLKSFNYNVLSGNDVIDKSNNNRASESLQSYTDYLLQLSSSLDDYQHKENETKNEDTRRFAKRVTKIVSNDNYKIFLLNLFQSKVVIKSKEKCIVKLLKIANRFRQLSNLCYMVKITFLHKNYKKIALLKKVIAHWKSMKRKEHLTSKTNSIVYRNMKKLHQQDAEELLGNSLNSYQSSIRKSLNQSTLFPIQEDKTESILSPKKKPLIIQSKKK